MHRPASPVVNLWLGAFLIAVCAASLWETRDIPPGTFEPLGSAPVPQAVALVVIVLVLVVMVRAWLQLRSGAPRPADDVKPRWGDAAAVAGLTVLYVLALHLRLGRFDVLSAIYLFITIALLVRFRRGSLPIIAGISALTGFGCQYVFTRVFVVDLPGAF